MLETVAELGYDGVDLDAEPDRIPREKFDEVVNMATGLGLKIPSLVGAWHAGEERDLASTDEEGRKRAVDYAKRCLDLGATIGSPVYEICAAAGKPEYPVSSTPKSILRKNFIESAREITEHAEKTNTYVAIEAINRFEGHAGFLNAVEEALPIAEEIGSDHIGVLADLFHVNMEDGPVPEIMRRAGKRLLHIHLADSNRQAPGTGHIDFLDVIRTLNEIGFDGYLALDSIPPLPDWKTLVRQTLPFMKQMEATAALQEEIKH